MPGKTIMIIDDEPSFIEMVKLRLEANGYKTVGATEGNEAMEKLSQFIPDLILLDIMMPGMDGYTFLRELRSNDQTKRIPVIVVTGRPDMKELFEIEGIEHYILKSGDMSELLNIIKGIIGD